MNTPDTRLSVMLAVARRELRMTTAQASAVCGRSKESVSNLECGLCAMADGPARRLILHYLNALGLPTPQPELPIRQLVEQLAVAVLTHRTARAAAMLAATESGADAVVLAVVNDGLHADRWAGNVIRRLRYRLDAEARRREEAFGERMAG